MDFLNKFLPKKEAIMKNMPKAISKEIYPKEVMEIHHEFETAADKLLSEAESIIAEAATKDTDKVNRLEALGFKQAVQVTEIKPLIQKAELSKEQVELVNYYKRESPLNKFITEEQVKAICHKYNLVCGDVDRFKGFVPEKNLREIEKFKLGKNEQNAVTTSIGLTFKNAEVRIAHYNSTYWHIYKKGTNLFSFQSTDGVNFYGGLRDNPFGLSDSFQSARFSINNKLKICAPIKDMDISGLELIEGYKLEKKHIPDPVVLQPVNGGYLILTAWGDEASDPLVVNERNN